MIALLLLAGMATSSLAMQTSVADHESRTGGGCHEHGKSAPQPKSPDYACCVAGHSVAVVQAVVHLGPAAQVVVNLITDTDFQTSAMLGENRNSPVLPDIPSGSIPLRI